MKLSQIPTASTVLAYRSRAQGDLNELLAAEEQGRLLAELRFFGRHENDPFRIFSDDGVTTRLPFNEAAYKHFTESIVAAAKAYLTNEIDLSNRALTELGIDIDE